MTITIIHLTFTNCAASYWTISFDMTALQSDSISMTSQFKILVTQWMRPLSVLASRTQSRDIREKPDGHINQNIFLDVTNKTNQIMFAQLATPA
jgi:hypothetical protein